MLNKKASLFYTSEASTTILALPVQIPSLFLHDLRLPANLAL